MNVPGWKMWDKSTGIEKGIGDQEDREDDHIHTSYKSKSLLSIGIGQKRREVKGKSEPIRRNTVSESTRSWWWGWSKCWRDHLTRFLLCNKDHIAQIMISGPDSMQREKETEQIYLILLVFIAYCLFCYLNIDQMSFLTLFYIHLKIILQHELLCSLVLHVNNLQEE